MDKDSRLYFMATTALACAFVALGLFGDGYLHKFALLVGGVCIGHLLTEALNYDEEK